MPTRSHQRIVAYLYQMMLAFIAAHELSSEVLFAPLRIRLWSGKYREPDLIFLLDKSDSRQGEQYWTGADLVVEVISPDDPGRDLVTKRREYAQAGIPEYWIVDPRNGRITVLSLAGEQYQVHGHFDAGTQAASVLLAGFVVDVTAVFAAVK